ncbi:hypothetical protein SRHO_G00270160 [Serrasalmus rhombeus]
MALGQLALGKVSSVSASPPPNCTQLGVFSLISSSSESTRQGAKGKMSYIRAARARREAKRRPNRGRDNDRWRVWLRFGSKVRLSVYSGVVFVVGGLLLFSSLTKKEKSRAGRKTQPPRLASPRHATPLGKKTKRHRAVPGNRKRGDDKRQRSERGQGGSLPRRGRDFARALGWKLSSGLVEDQGAKPANADRELGEADPESAFLL